MKIKLRKDIVKTLEFLSKSKNYSDTIKNLILSNQKQHLEILRLKNKLKVGKYRGA